MRLLAWMAVLALVVLGIWLVWGEGWEQSFTLEGAVSWLEAAGRWAWLGGLGLLVTDVLLPVPSTMVMSGLGWVYGPVAGGLLASLGSIGGGMAGYGLCRLLGEKAARRLLGDRDFERGRLWLSGGGGWLVALTRAVPIFPEVIACTAGLVRMPFGRFAVALCCGSVPVGFLFAWIGAAGREEPGWAFAWSVLVPGLLWGSFRLWARRRRRAGTGSAR